MYIFRGHLLLGQVTLPCCYFVHLSICPIERWEANDQLIREGQRVIHTHLFYTEMIMFSIGSESQARGINISSKQDFRNDLRVNELWRHKHKQIIGCSKGVPYRP